MQENIDKMVCLRSDIQKEINRRIEAGGDTRGMREQELRIQGALQLLEQLARCYVLVDKREHARTAAWVLLAKGKLRELAARKAATCECELDV